MVLRRWRRKRSFLNSSISTGRSKELALGLCIALKIDKGKNHDANSHCSWMNDRSVPNNTTVLRRSATVLPQIPPFCRSGWKSWLDILSDCV
mmetsp:Transcript_4741/g.11330  ORF Transcript_4741/g.11330 Transcript_4741/m.11330 type:complete len:92 (-) Transcript_4741:171-446(-)